MFNRIALLFTAVVCALILPAPSAHAGLVESCADWLLVRSSLIADKSEINQRKIKSVFKEATSFWATEFARRGWPFVPPKLKLYSRQTLSECDEISRELGPIYCPNDHSVYIDLGFFAFHQDVIGWPSEGLLNYIIGHEVGHHVQNLRNTFVTSGHYHASRDAQDKIGKSRIAGTLNKKIELQADCLSGVFIGGKIFYGILQPQIVNDVLAVAAKVGDDTFAIRAAGRGELYVSDRPHGSSKDRKKWTLAGITALNLDVCEPFEKPLLGQP